ncbi:NFX1-type zinc finger protein, partial [Rhizoctonia solani AG-3 Rhs1AP]
MNSKQSATLPKQTWRSSWPLVASKSKTRKLLPLSGKQVFKVIFVTIFEYLTRFKDATITNPGICEFTEQMVQWFDEWVAALESNPPFEDKYITHNQSDRDFIIENLRRDKEHILHLVRRGQTVVVINREAQSSYKPPNDANLALLAELERVFEYDGPGDHSEIGRPRHDNDHTEIEMIQVIPTRDELLCEADPYLPGNFYEAPHYHDPGSVERLLDIQYRLLREEFTSPLRLAVQNVVADLKKSRSGIDVLSQKLNARSGLYVTATGRDSIRFSVFTGITFQPLKLNHRGLSAGVDFDTPPGKARSHNPAARVTYWEQASKKRLMQDGLVVLVWKTPAGKVDVYLGTVASASQDLVRCARRYGGQDRMSIRVSFFDTKANVRISKSIQNHRDSNDTRVLIEAPVFFESIRPFLEGLKREPERLPFAQYLRLQTKDELVQTTIDPPLYSRSPGFSFELKDLFLPAAGVASLRLTTRDPDSVANARTRLIQDSRLDPSQAEAVIHALTREVALIQGPPGTGKSYTGLEIIRILIKNNICPILLVAFTNHALDHMLTGILDAEITNNIIRLGARSSDERLTPYLLSNVGKLTGKSPLAASRKEANIQQKELESQMNELMNEITSCKVPSSHIEEHISYMYPHHYGELFRHTPTWIDAITTKPSDTEEEWEVAGESPEQQSIIDFWLDGRDLKFLETPGDELEPLARQDFLRGFMREHGLKDVPKIPKSTRPLGVLQKNPGVWRMSRNERTALHKAWSIEASDVTHGTQIQKFEQVWLAHKAVSKQHKEITEQLKAEFLSRSHIVGCTTTGAAKFASLISGMGPKILIVEEAGQVLESHILASLVGSMQHVILIGDPQQLRPNINCYELATENPNTGQVYKFDQSLMERLSSSGFPMSQIDVQRRMRPEISSLIKNTLYPNLIDNERVLRYPNVRGMHKNMFFFSHTHKEAGGGDESVSKHNSFEVDMIYDLVLHLLKQGCYNTPGNIVILAAYLGQIPKLRKKLEDIVTIVIDERDAELLDLPTNDGEEAGTIKQVELSKQVTIRTLDNFQGEEGEVIILSLVRNSETPFDEVKPGLEYKGKAPIGFLKNFTNPNASDRNFQYHVIVIPTMCNGLKIPASCRLLLPTGDVAGRVKELCLAVTYAHYW